MENKVNRKVGAVDCMALEQDFYGYVRAAEEAEEHFSTATLTSFVPAEASVFGLLQKMIVLGSIGLAALVDSQRAQSLANNAAIFDEKCNYGALKRSFHPAPERMPEQVAAYVKSVL